MDTYANYRFKYEEKQLKDIKILLFTFEKIISNQSMFVSDRTTNMQVSKMKNKVYWSFVTIQYRTKCNNPLYQKFANNKFCVFTFFVANLTRSLLIDNDYKIRCHTFK